MSQLIETSHFSGEGWRTTAVEGTPEAAKEVATTRITGPISAEVGELAIVVKPRPTPDGVMLQGDVSITLDGVAVKNVQKIVLTGDARTGWSAELTLYPLVAK